MVWREMTSSHIVGRKRIRPRHAWWTIILLARWIEPWETISLKAYYLKDYSFGEYFLQWASHNCVLLTIIWMRQNNVTYIKSICCTSPTRYFETQSPLNFVFMENDARSRAARISKSFFTACGIAFLAWPTCSPFLNPRENLWGLLTQS